MYASLQTELELIYCALIFSTQEVEALTPKFVKKFRSGTRRIIKITRGNSFHAPQANLRILETEGKGNCVAWSKFMVKNAYKYKIKFNNYIVAKICNRTKEDRPESHQITVLEDHTGQLWLQSNYFIYQVKNLDDALRRVTKKLGWNLGCSKTREFVISKEDLYSEDHAILLLEHFLTDTSSCLISLLRLFAEKMSNG